MYRKFFISFLLLALINLLAGCYSSETITVPEYNQIKEEDKPDEIRVITKDTQQYHFYDSGYYIHNDTLYGKVSVKELYFEGKFAFWEIESIQFENFDWYKPSLISVTELKKIEVETGKPDEIYLTKLDSTRYHFMKDDYYIENDTLYGKGKLIIEKGAQLDRSIALSNIQSIEVESINWLTTGLLSLGIVVVTFVVIVAIAYALGAFDNWGGK